MEATKTKETASAQLSRLRQEQGPLTPEQQKAVEAKAEEARRQIDRAVTEVAVSQAEKENTNVFDICARYLPAVSIVKDKDAGGRRVVRVTLQPRNAAAVDNGTNQRAKRRREAKMASKIEFKKNG